MVSSFVESHRVGQLRSIGQLAVVAVDKTERFPMDSKLAVGLAVANFFSVHILQRKIKLQSQKQQRNLLRYVCIHYRKKKHTFIDTNNQ